MGLTAAHLELLLKLAATAQLAIAPFNLVLVRITGWREDLGRLPLLIREVFHVHSWFISVTVGIFAVMTWRFSAEMAEGSNDVAAWLAAAMGVFWTMRRVLQVTYYSSSHWRGLAGRTLAHVVLLLVYGGLVAVYLRAGCKGLCA